jgi:hypothetical protein
VKGTEAVDDAQLEYKFTSQEDMVVFNNCVRSLQNVLSDQRETKPDAQICYHKTKIDEENPKTFTCSQTHRVAFTLSEAASADINHANIGAKESFPQWCASDVVSVLWVVRWTAKGLMPVKPVMHLTKGALVLPPGRCCAMYK